MSTITAPRPGSLASRLAAQTCSVLVVEDDADIALFLRAYLRATGMGTSHLRPVDGRDVVEAVEALQPACILLDHQLSPDLTSFEVLDALHAAGVMIPVIVVSGDASLDEADVRTAGARAFVRKPFSAVRLVEIVQQVIGSY